MHMWFWRPLPEKYRQLPKKRLMRGGKNYAGGPEKQVILFVWPNFVLQKHLVE